MRLNVSYESIFQKWNLKPKGQSSKRDLLWIFSCPKLLD